MKHPLGILGVEWIEVVPFLKVSFQHFNFREPIELQIAIAFSSTGFGHPKRLPTNYNYLIARCTGDAVWMDYTRKRLARQRNSTRQFFLTRLIHQRSSFFYREHANLFSTGERFVLVWLAKGSHFYSNQHPMKAPSP